MLGAVIIVLLFIMLVVQLIKVFTGAKKKRLYSGVGNI